ncbi:hypothetical protein CLG96_01955 [Sphingomonas oleivorans]|uniref:HNH endonuclease n=1 Tax=Sphingomonas oleivorans TaxID=1735121 RepID=A0A2T5G1A8_9SPHN|nr:hypothetical protein [Sphingomonas oleivorans]PTQ12929.1 hypothetical protein CLG96_01955 [Sphingomonas oleivorans]
MGTKTEDWNTIPLCDGHHKAQHSKGWQTFQAMFDFDASALAVEYAERSPHRSKWDGQGA